MPPELRELWMPHMRDFGERLTSVFESRGRLCVGIDPHPFLLESWGLPDSASGVEAFGMRVVDAAASVVGIIKPQVAFFERHGSAGYAALEAVMGAARSAGLLIVADAKRGDVGSSVDAYGQAWLTPGSPLEADALTVSAFQGVGSLDAPVALALASGKGIFVLAATSNPESVAPQSALISTGDAAGLSVAGSIVRNVAQMNDALGLGSIGVVLGATLTLADYGIRPEWLDHSPILAPGFGAQGAHIRELKSTYGGASSNVIVAVSREILGVGPTQLETQIARQARALAEVYS